MKLLQSGFYLHEDGTYWRLVPADPTREMLDALQGHAQCAGFLEEGYDAMLKAAPASPIEDPVVVEINATAESIPK